MPLEHDRRIERAIAKDPVIASHGKEALAYQSLLPLLYVRALRSTRKDALRLRALGVLRHSPTLIIGRRGSTLGIRPLLRIGALRCISSLFDLIDQMLIELHPFWIAVIFGPT